MNLRETIERFTWGLTRPLVLLVALRKNPKALHRAISAAFVQLFATLILTGAVVAYRADELADHRAERRKLPKVKVELPKLSPEAIEGVQAGVEEARQAAEDAARQAAEVAAGVANEAVGAGSDDEPPPPHRGSRRGNVGLPPLPPLPPPFSEELSPDGEHARSVSRPSRRQPRLRDPEAEVEALEDIEEVAGPDTDTDTETDTETEAEPASEPDSPGDPEAAHGEQAIALRALEKVADTLEAQEEQATSPEEKRELRKALNEIRKQVRAQEKQVRQVAERERDNAERAAARAEREADRAAKRAEAAAEEVDEDDVEAQLPWWQRLWAIAVSAVFAAQYVVLALGRDYQDRTSRDLALVAGIEPEEDDIAPRVRVDWKWLRRKLRRRIRGLMVLIPGFLIASPVFLLARIFSFDVLTSVLTGVWTFYWWMVFSAARTARAWVWEATAEPNAPLRGWMWLTHKVPGFRWFGPRLVSWIWIRTTHSMFSPAKAVELDPAAFAGLAVARLIGNVPLIRIFVRPVMSVVAAEILVRRAVKSPQAVEVPDDVMDPPQRARDQADVL